MNIMIGGRNFSCVELSEAELTDLMGVYVILCIQEDGSWSVLDVGHRGQVVNWIDDHERQASWNMTCPNNSIWVGVCQMPSCQYTNPDLERFEAEIRNQYGLH